MNIQQSLAPHTVQIFHAISRLECIRPFTLVGGTALSLQIGKRQSEDLDFMKWVHDKNDKPDVDWPSIRKELETIGSITECDVLGFDHVIFVVEGVKLSFYAAPRYEIPTMTRIHLINNLYVADVGSIGAMKMETMLRRAQFRDYYDIYSILKEGYDINSMMAVALKHSGHRLKSRNLMAILTNGSVFTREPGFDLLRPEYDVTAADIQEYIKQCLIKAKEE